MKSFYQWIRDHVDEQSAVGNFARRICIDPTFPTGMQTKEEILRHLSKYNDEQLLRTFYEMWNIYTHYQFVMDMKM